MDPNIKQKWVEALRSGQYEQGEGYLKAKIRTDDYYYCCLGVLCDIIEDGHWENSVNRGNDVHKYVIGDSVDGSTSYLPNELSERIGLNKSDIEEVLVDMNDQGESFETIAYWIEDNL